MPLSSLAIQTYRRSLSGWMGYVRDTQIASAFDRPAVEVLGLILEEDEFMSDFLSRYPRDQRDRRKKEVRRVVLLWLIEFAE
ncbi:MAG: hypothetical protein ACOVS5_12210 [Oligoflexus sp.]